MTTTSTSDRDRTALTIGEVAALLSTVIAADGESPALDGLISPGDAAGWITDLIAAEAAAYHDDYHDATLDPPGAFRAQRRLRSLHFALGLVNLLDERF